MKKILFAAFLLTSTALANEDVCCVFSQTKETSVQTFSWVVSSSECKAGKTVQGKNVCASVADPENTYCSTESTAQDRCTKCGFFWSGKECLTENPKDAAKKELEAEMKKKKEDQKNNPTTSPTNKTTTTPGATTEPNPDDDQLFNRKNKSKNEGFDSGE